jgi:formamidase
MTSSGDDIVKVSEFVDLVGPETAMLGPVKDGGLIVTGTEPACYGPMITPEVESGHTVSRPVAVMGAEVGDGVALKIRKINITSKAAASGTETPRETAISAFDVTSGYTMVFDDNRTVGVTVPGNVAAEIARNAEEYSGAPAGSTCHSVLVFALADMPAGIVSKIRPMIGNVGTLPGVTMPSSHNAGDFGVFLVGAPHDHAITEEDLARRSDAHMDVDSVGEGAIVIAPVKVEQAGIIVGRSLLRSRSSKDWQTTDRFYYL